MASNDTTTLHEVPERIWWCRPCDAGVGCWGLDNDRPPPHCPDCRKSDFSPVKYEPMRSAALMTGSHVYGKPRPLSDVDLVIFIDGGVAVDLASALMVDVPESKAGEYPTIQFKVGDLNLILESDPAKFRAWEEGTKALIAIAPVTREYAVAVFQDLFSAVEAKA